MSTKTEKKGPDKDAAKKLRDLYFEVTKRPLPPEGKKEIEEMLKKRKEQVEKNNPKKHKKIAKSDKDAGLL